MTTVSSIGEVALIRRLSRRLPTPSSVSVGIGDDAAVVRLPTAARRNTGRVLVASDMLVEGVHFRLPGSASRGGDRAGASGVVAPRWVGWKALACNVSDIAAMGGVPLCAVVSLGAAPSTPVAVVDALYRGLAACATRFGVAIVGGDTVRAPQLVVDVAIVGTAEQGRIVLRSGAKPGDRVFVTGTLGGSLASGRHARFIPRLVEAQRLIRRVPVHAMMDLSDGLASDAWQMARASGVTIRLDERAIPVAAAAKTTWRALMDGEDFELLFTVPERAAGRVPSRIGRVRVTAVGRVVGRRAGVELERADGRRVALKPQGFRHF